MEILEKGTLPKHEFKCRNCGTKFIAEGDEFGVSFADSISDGVSGICGECYSTIYTSTCPLCGKEVNDYDTTCFDEETWFDKLCDLCNKIFRRKER